MSDLNIHTLTDAVIARMTDEVEPRTRQLMSALIRHLHAFATEVSLSEAEWFTAIDFLTWEASPHCQSTTWTKARAREASTSPESALRQS